MHFNYDLVTWIEYFIGAFISCFGAFVNGKILLQKKFKDIKMLRILLVIPFSAFLVLNNLAFNNIFTMFGSLLVFALIYKCILNEKGSKIIIYSIVSFIILLLCDILFALFVSLFDYIFKLNIAVLVTKSILSNTIIAILMNLLAFILRKIIMKYIEKLNKSNILILCLQGLLTIIIIFSSINYLYIEKWKFSYKFILIVIIIFGSAILTFTLMKQYLKNKEVVTKYKMSEEYLKTSASLIEKYSTTIHRYKNNLIILKGYIKSDSNEATKYIDGLLEKFEDKKYSWVKKINYIPIDTIRYVIYYKLSKAEEKNLKIFVNVSTDIKSNNNVLNSNQLGHILDIIGEYFDNAIYAANESKEKVLNFDLYKEDDNIIFKIANTYEGTVNLNLITKNGYTTKGKGHGLGLYDIDKTIKNMNILSNSYEIIDNYFITTLKINIKGN